MSTEATLGASGEGIGPFDNVSDALRQCWQLGHNDGRLGLDPKVGETALNAFVVAGHQKQFDQAALVQATKRGQLAISQRRRAQLETKLTELSESALPRYGYSRIRWGAWVLPASYLFVALVAIVAEFAVSAQTVAESIGAAVMTDADIETIWKSSMWSLMLMLGLLGISIKIFVDSLHHSGSLRWVERAVAATALVLSVFCIYALAELRDAIGLADTAAIKIWSGTTFKWVTWALPAFAAACLVVSFHQFRSFSLHNAVVSRINEITTALDELQRHEAAAEQELRTADEHLARLEDRQAALHDFAENASGTYRHGYASGLAERQSADAQLSLYERLRAQLHRRLPDIMGGATL